MKSPAGRDSTRERITAAAVAEFSRYGVAGSRVERIAKAAKTSKERVYAHFGSKEALYAHVAGQELTAVAEATRLDPADLPGYAGRVHDYFTAHPDRFRLMSWGRLDPDAAARRPDDPVRQSVDGKVELLRDAQRAGLLEPGWDPLDILVLVDRIATSWAARHEAVPAADERERREFLAARRAAVVDAVRRLFPPASGAGEGADR
jgi:AcrR family transcriptional regulator